MKPHHWLGYLFLSLLLVVAVQLVAILLGVTHVGYATNWEMLWDSDSYLWLSWVRDAMHDGSLPQRYYERMNAPEGASMHWTLPYASILALGASAGTLFTDFDQALHLWGMFNGPLTQLLIAMLLVWGCRSFLPHRATLLVLLLFTTLRGVFHQTAMGQADHHALLLFLMLWSLLLLVRGVQQKPSASPKVWILAGFVSGLTIWVSIEGLLLIIPTTISLGVLWLYGNQRAIGWLERYAAGLSLTLTAAILIELPRQQWLTPAFDQISIAQLWLACALWVGSLLLISLQQRYPYLSKRQRALFGLAISTPLFGLLLWLYPGYIDGPHPNLGPIVEQLMEEGQQDEQPYLPTSAFNRLGMIIDFGPMLFALSYCALALRGNNPARRDRSILYLAFMLTYTLFSLAKFRGIGFLQISYLLPWAEFILLMTQQFNSVASQARSRWGYAAAITLALALHWLIAAPLWWQDFRQSRFDWGLDRSGYCKMVDLATYLETLPGEHSQQSVLTWLYDTPKILYRSSFSIINSPYHRNIEGMEDGFNLQWGDANSTESYQLARKHALGYVAYCNRYLYAHRQPIDQHPLSLINRLAYNRPPEWLERLPLPEGLDQQYQVFKTRW